MELSIYFPQNIPITYLLQLPKNGYWFVKKPLSMGTIICVPVHEIYDSKETIPTNVYYRVGRPLHCSSINMYKVESLPLFSPNKNLRHD